MMVKVKIIGFILTIVISGGCQWVFECSFANRILSENVNVNFPIAKDTVF